jgi:disabled family protein 2
MCQVAMAKLKAAVKATGEHKQKIVINVTLDGVKIIDEKSTEVVHMHEVHRISFIARDSGDSRAFGYVYRRTDGTYQFIGIKTEKAAESLVLSLRDLFLAVYDIKKKKLDVAENGQTSADTSSQSVDTSSVEKTPAESDKKTKFEEAKTDDEKISSTEENLLNLDLDESDMTQSSGVRGFSTGPSMWMTLDPWTASTQSGLRTANVSAAVPTNIFYPSVPPTAIQLPQTIFAHPPMQSSSSPFITSPFRLAGPPSTSFGVMPAAIPAVLPAGSLAFPMAATTWPPPLDNASHVIQRPTSLGASPSVTTAWPTSFSFGSPPPAINDPFLMNTPVAGHGATAAGMPVTSSGGYIQAPLIPPRISLGSTPSSPGNPFVSSSMTANGGAGGTGAKTTPASHLRQDPFADLGILSTIQQQPGKKTEKRDFFCDSPKPTLIDLTQQQLKQQSAVDFDIFGAKPFSSVTTVNDPFA